MSRSHRKLLSWKRFSLDESSSIVALYCDGRSRVALSSSAKYSLHDELAAFVAAGLTPMEALQTATLNAARYLGMTDAFGTVEVGKTADLVLLEADPLSDIANTGRIAAVVLNGRFIPKSELQKMLADVEAAARNKK